MADDDILSLSATGIAARVGNGSMSAAEVAAAFTARVDAINPTINAVCTLNPDFQDEAALIDARLASGETPRALEGVPMVVKDIIQTAGIRTTFGSRIREDWVPDEDALSVERLKAAGAVILGKTNTPEFAHDINTKNALFGVTRNPWDPAVTAGGSSGGTAAAIAAGMVPGGLGTDLGGSIRIPAAFCGIAGLRPTPGRVAVYPAEFGWDTLVEHVQGPMAASVDDLGLMLSVLAGPDDRDPSSLPASTHDYVAAAAGQTKIDGARIAFCRDFGGVAPMEPEVADLAVQAGEVFADIGCTVETACFDLDGLAEIIAGSRAFGMVGRYADLLDEHRDIMTPPLLDQASQAMTFDVRTITDAERLRTEYWHRVRRLLADFDFILTPTLGIPAFALDGAMPFDVGGRKVERFLDLILTTYAFSVTGLPAASVPCGFTASGLPVGLQIVGHRHRDDRVLAAAAAFETARPEHFRRVLD